MRPRSFHMGRGVDRLSAGQLPQSLVQLVTLDDISCNGLAGKGAKSFALTVGAN
jgi:hypothetical protein